jgi:hypothetical protein
MEEDREQEIRQKAYALWERSGRPEGEDQRFWRLAEADSAFEDEKRGPQRQVSSSGTAQTGGIASGLQPSGRLPGGGSSTSLVGSVGTGGGSTGGAATGSVKREGR